MNARWYTTLVHVTSISLLSGTVRSALSMRPRCAKIRHGRSPGTPSSLDDATRGAKKTYAHAPWRAEPATQLFFGSVVIVTVGNESVHVTHCLTDPSMAEGKLQRLVALRS